MPVSAGAAGMILERVPARPTYAEASRALLRTTLLDAVGVLLRERSWASVTMAGVAAAAGVSRQTVYNEFGSRRAVAEAYVLQETARFLDEVEVELTTRPLDPHAAMLAALHHFLRAAAEHPLVRAAVDPDGGDELLALVTSQGGAVIAGGSERLAAIIVATWPVVGDADARPLAETVVRLAVSHAVLPGGTPEESAAAILGLLAPWISEKICLRR